jgi:phosphoribosylanthranilate isomerase
MIRMLPGPPQHFRIKICGLTNAADAQAAIAAGADALGFNGWPSSKRYLNLAEAKPWVAALDLFVQRFAVLVNPSQEELEQIARLKVFDGVQLHGDEPPEFCARAKEFFPHVLKAFHIGSWQDACDAANYGLSDILLDAVASAPGEYGGTGRTTNWEIAARLVAERPDLRVILSGGLNAYNVGDAVRQVRPSAVDVASGVEMTGNPRRKDPKALTAFCNAVALASAGA